MASLPIPNLTAAMMALCAQYQGQYHEACVKALDAGTRQSGIRQQYDSAEGRVTQRVNQTAEDVLGKDVMSAAGSGAFVYRAVSQRSVTLKLPTLGLANSLTSTVSPASCALTVKWNW